MCGGAIIATLIPSTGRRLITAYLWPEDNSNDWSNRECRCSLENDESLLRFVKRSRIECCFNCTQVNPHSYLSSINKVRVHQDTGWSLNLNMKRSPERSNKKRKNHWHNSGKRKTCDRNVNHEDNLEYCWPLLTKSLDEEVSDETSYSSSDSETYSGPSGLSF